MIDLTKYSEDELSLNVFKDEFLYNLRHRKDLVFTLDEMFIYTEEQLGVLQHDLIDDKEVKNV